ncbi:MAG: hypothetical protein ACRC92_20390 [Peptostreptococcaceae bacterium]
MVYVAKLPLYRKVFNNGNSKYYYTAEENKAEDIKLNAKGTKYLTSRFKGLGEMNGDQLFETAFNKETRILIRVSRDGLDAAGVNNLIEDYMGVDSKFRKELITKSIIED